MLVTKTITVAAALMMAVLLQSSLCLGDDRPNVVGTWKLVTFVTEDLHNKSLESVYDHMDGYLGFTANGRVFAFATADGSRPNTPARSDVSHPMIAYSGTYHPDGSEFSAKVDMLWEDGGPHTSEMHRYRLLGEKQLVETVHLRYPNAFGSELVGIVIWERTTGYASANP